jgi:dTMP kinase
MLIVFEGADGAGKTHLMREVNKQLRAKGIEATLTREPGCGNIEVCKIIRGIVLNPKISLDANSEFLLFMVDRLEHYRQVIEPQQSRLILQDRNYLSTEVYQIHMAMTDKVPEEFIAIHRALAEIPDGYVFVNTPVELCLKRLKTDKEKGSKFDGKDEEFHKRVHKYYAEVFAENHKTEKIVVDGTFPSELNAKNVIDWIETIKEVRVR